jgi:uncharacterized membrane protein
MAGNVTTAPPIIPADIAALTAPQLFGTIFNWALYGVLTIQVYIYHLNFPDDKKAMKALVYGAFLLETAQTALSAADLYHWFAVGYGNLDYLDQTYLSPVDTPMLCGIMASIVQIFYAYRIYALRRSLKWVSVFIIATSITQTTAAIYAAGKSFELGNFSKFHNYYPMNVTFLIWNIAGCVSDVVIAISMTYVFQTTRKNADMAAINILAKAVQLIVETNSLTATIALVSFIMYIHYPSRSYFICSTLVMGKLYSNTLLVTFNNRLALRKLRNPRGSFSAQGSSGGFRSFQFSSVMDIGGDISQASNQHSEGSGRTRPSNATYHIGKGNLGPKGTGTGSTSKGSVGDFVEIEVLKRVEVESSH